MTQASIGYGSKLAAGDGAVPEVFTDIAEVVSISGPDDTTALVDATNMDSPQGRREFIYGLTDGGSVTFDVNFLPQSASQKLLRLDRDNKVTRNYRLTFSDAAGTTVIFAGLVQDLKRSAAIDSVVRMSVTLKVSGALTWAP